MKRTPRNAAIVVVVVTAFVLAIFLSPGFRNAASRAGEANDWLRRVGFPLFMACALVLIGLIYGFFFVTGRLLRSRVERERLRRGLPPRDRSRLLGRGHPPERNSP